ncbi:MAG: SusD/RagB family nutrient-binding outer membrane lipoprotein [Chitinophagaceae bacterium]
MKIKAKIKIFISVTLILLAGSCTKDFVEMNTNPNSATVVPATNVMGQAILNACYTLFGERLDIYYAGTWSGHMASIGSGDYEYRVGINNDQWKGMYTTMTYAVDAMRLAEAEGNNNLYAAALTLKAYVAHKATDMWGKIPYSEAFQLEKGKLYPKYDTEQEVYTQILAELKTAADIFSITGGKMGAGDFLFKGNLDKWKKFCNSTRLRVAIRMSSADEAGAKAVLADVLNNQAKYPVITSNDDNAYFWWPGVAPDQELWYRRMGADNGNKTDQYRTSHFLISNLISLNDPRLPVYADKNKWGIYNGYKFGPTQTSDTLNNGNNVSHIGNRFGNNKAGFSPFMNAAEVYFIKAEAYQRNLIAGGDAKAAYDAGITISLQENGIAAPAIAAYFAQGEVPFNGGTTTKLYKIYLQKWISLFKQSVEAWAEARRTDVPLMDVITKDYYARHNRPPFRMSYADEEKSLNTNFPTQVVETDIFWGTQMWWDKRTGVR